MISTTLIQVEGHLSEGGPGGLEEVPLPHLRRRQPHPEVEERPPGDQAGQLLPGEEGQAPRRHERGEGKEVQAEEEGYTEILNILASFREKLNAPTKNLNVFSHSQQQSENEKI